MKDRERKRNKGFNVKQWVLLAVVFACLIGAGGFWVYWQQKKDASAIRSGGNVSETEPSNVVKYDGKSYVYNKNLKTILFMGVDKHEEVKVQEHSGMNGQTDVLLLLVMDKKNKTTSLLSISRNSMVDLQIYSVDGKLVTSTNGQIALQYAYGDGEKKSCRLTKEAVANLLYGIPIDAYLSMNIDGIGAVVSALGGIEYTFTEDETEIDPAYTKGSTVLMDEKQTERYVRYRDTGQAGSNEQRMQRQIRFLRTVLSKMKKTGDFTNSYDELLDSVEPYVVTDLTAEEIKALSEYDMSDTVENVPGELRQGEKYEEYVVDDAKLYQLILQMFYVESEK